MPPSCVRTYDYYLQVLAAVYISWDALEFWSATLVCSNFIFQVSWTFSSFSDRSNTSDFVIFLYRSDSLVSSGVKRTLSVQDVWGSNPGLVKSAQCRQRLVTAATFFRSCVALALSRGMSPALSYSGEHDEDLIFWFIYRSNSCLLGRVLGYFLRWAIDLDSAIIDQSQQQIVNNAQKVKKYFLNQGWGTSKAQRATFTCSF